MIRLGLIGAGQNGIGNITNLVKHSDRCRLVAVADPMLEAAQPQTFQPSTPLPVMKNYSTTSTRS
ncbi:MAG: hypothetical protein PF961_18605 [Planctomycetota bacterium]|jgi:predicted homoserine dehydrogenase-like protein|nr:hypothetical protein [Planctomycetota bacterium]